MHQGWAMAKYIREKQTILETGILLILLKKNKLWQITDFALKGATEESFRGAHWFQPRHISSRDWRLHGSIRQLSARGLVVPHTVLDGQIQAVLQALDGDSGCQTSRDKGGGGEVADLFNAVASTP